MKKLFFKLLLITVLIPLFSSCGLNKVKYTERTRLITISETDEIKMGLKASEDIKKENKDLLDKDKKLLARVQKIGKKLALAANKSNFNWEFHTISKDVLNAFCLPGGKIYIYSGITKVAKNDDQLATVISHEIAHAVARHGAERMAVSQVTQVGKQVLQTLIKVTKPEYEKAFDAAYGYGASLGVILPYSRKHEYEADKIGLILMNQSGYDTRQALLFWKNMKALSDKQGKSSTDYFSTHPSDDKRIAKIKKFNKGIGKS
jgi:predicted Zn-dependent protease